MGFLKEKDHQFRRWQQQPFEYHDTDDRHVCSNCGNEYENNYCPRCGQEAIHGPISWKSVWQGIMDVWGVGTRSLPYSIWQLMFRPGYLIRDYISGKRQVSLPPVKMLVIVFFILYWVGRLIVPEFWNDMIEDQPFTGTKADGASYYLDLMMYKMGLHPDWAFLLLFSLMILPTWFVFRYAPRFPRHSLPQGFFIQVFMTVQFFVWVFLASLVFGSMHVAIVNERFFSLVFCLMNLVMLVDYKQLFGYSWWGTLWRIVAMALMLILALFFFLVPFSIYDRLYFTHETINWERTAIRSVVFIATIILTLIGIYFINRKPWKDGNWRFGKKSWITVVVLVALAVFFEYQFSALSLLVDYVIGIFDALATGG